MPFMSMTNRACVNLAGLTTLKMLAALYEQADVLVTTDTGPMHLGAAAGTRVVAIFGIYRTVADRAVWPRPCGGTFSHRMLPLL